MKLAMLGVQGRTVAKTSWSFRSSPLEIRQKGLREAPARPLHLYDTPYEPVLAGLDMDGDRPACPRPRESRLPEDDERPPEEYDQPWEWKKERISKAFAGERWELP